MAVCGVVPVAAVYSAGSVTWRSTWRIHYRHYRGTTMNTTTLYERMRGSGLDGTKTIGTPFEPTD